VACKESGGDTVEFRFRQFRDNGIPVISGDNGVGIMQLTDSEFRPLYGTYWDWRENVRLGAAKFEKKVAEAVVFADREPRYNSRLKACLERTGQTWKGNFNLFELRTSAVRLYNSRRQYRWVLDETLPGESEDCTNGRWANQPTVFYTTGATAPQPRYVYEVCKCDDGFVSAPLICDMFIPR